MFVYLITNKLNGKQYVGQTIGTIEGRWRRHTWPCNAKSGRMPISLAISKYGKENFLVEKLGEYESLDELNAAEKAFADALNTWSPNGYNLKAGNGIGAMSEVTKEKIRKANLGRKVSDETRWRLSASHVGLRRSEATRQKLSDCNKGKPLSASARLNSVIAVSKSYSLVSPSGDVIEVTNMASFCRQHDLSNAKMCEVVRGRRYKYKGWRATGPLDLPTSK